MSLFCCLLRCGRDSSAPGSSHRLHNSPCPRQSGCPQSHPPPHARSGAPGIGAAESRVVDRLQSPAQNSRLHLRRTARGSEAAILEVDPLARVEAAISAALRGTLFVYKRLISPMLPSACRFYPTCSDYMRQAIELHGPGTGLWLGLKRLSRCHPFHPGGNDPVPPPHSVRH